VDPDTSLIGSPITLAELKALGEFVRLQDVGGRVEDLVAARRLLHEYPLVESRLPKGRPVDLFVNGRWWQVRVFQSRGAG
jgi:hypothetical protein